MKNKLTKQLLTICLLLVFSAWVNAQLVWTTPTFPLESSPVTVNFDATQGSGGLAGYTGDVYAHTGVITDQSTSSSDWKHVKSDWGVNIPATHLTRITTNTYQLVIDTNIRDYYGVPQNEKILKMAFVFRSSAMVNLAWLEGKTSTDGDIFINVYEAGLQISINSPDKDALLVNLGADIPIAIESTYANSIQLFVNGLEIKNTVGNLLTDTITAMAYGKHWVKAIATNDTGAVADSFYYFVRKPAILAQLPAGTHDGINYLDDSTAILCLYAPFKQYVFVLGDFNNWQYDSPGYMFYASDMSRYWLKLEHLIPGKEYIYQYEIDGQIRIGDPYADKVSDPWNDKYIPAAAYPNLISYPGGKTSGIATVLQTAQSTYNWQVENFIPPLKTDLVIYELLLRDFVSTHNYQTLIDTLGYLQKLGINAIELMPFSEFEGNSSWGYNPNYYFAPDKYYGTKTALKQFVDACHAKGIAVIQDMVLNHSFGTSPMVMLYWDAANNRPSGNNPWFNTVAKHDYNVGFDFNHVSLATRLFVDDVLKYWLTEYHIDGFRFDLSKGFTQTNTLGNTDAWGQYDASRVAIWKRIADSIHQVKPDAYIILEHFANNDEETVLSNYGLMLWGNSNYNYNEATMGYSPGWDLSWASYTNRGWNEPNLVSYMESHDQERLMFKNITFGKVNGAYNLKDTITALQRQELAALFFFTIPGPKMVWQFGELGYDYSIDYNGRVGEKPIRWDYLDHWQRHYLNKFYSSLIDLKKNQDIFETTTFSTSLAGASKRINLTANGKSASIIGNFDVQPSSIDPAFTHTGYWYDYFSGDSINVTQINAPIALGLGEYHLYTDFRLDKPDIGMSISNPLLSANSNKVVVYPNPSTGKFSIAFSLETPKKIRIDLVDLNGNQIALLSDKNLSSGIKELNFDLSSFGNLNVTPGIYFLHLSAADFNSYVKLVIIPR
ncbi:MAG: alpha-amylase family glycosyl hydrolase [Bacteroidales bacterium]